MHAGRNQSTAIPWGLPRRLTAATKKTAKNIAYGCGCGCQGGGLIILSKKKQLKIKPHRWTVVLSRWKYICLLGWGLRSVFGICVAQSGRKNISQIDVYLNSYLCDQKYVLLGTPRSLPSITGAAGRSGRSGGSCGRRRSPDHWCKGDPAARAHGEGEGMGGGADVAGSPKKGWKAKPKNGGSRGGGKRWVARGAYPGYKNGGDVNNQAPPSSFMAGQNTEFSTWTEGINGVYWTVWTVILGTLPRLCSITKQISVIFQIIRGARWVRWRFNVRVAIITIAMRYRAIFKKKENWYLCVFANKTCFGPMTAKKEWLYVGDPR